LYTLEQIGRKEKTVTNGYKTVTDGFKTG